MRRCRCQSKGCMYLGYVSPSDTNECPTGLKSDRPPLGLRTSSVESAKSDIQWVASLRADPLCRDVRRLCGSGREDDGFGNCADREGCPDDEDQDKQVVVLTQCGHQSAGDS
jgi:hypothetical protein